MSVSARSHSLLMMPNSATQAAPVLDKPSAREHRIKRLQRQRLGLLGKFLKHSQRGATTESHEFALTFYIRSNRFPYRDDSGLQGQQGQVIENVKEVQHSKP